MRAEKPRQAPFIEGDVMKLTFKENVEFAKVREELLGGDEGYRALQNLLLANPRVGDVIPHTHGARKMRIQQGGSNRGKRAGLRVIYLYIESRELIVFVAAYAKNVASDLTPEQSKRIAEAPRRERAEG